MPTTATLDAVDFLLAHREGFRRFSGVYRQARGFAAALTGLILSPAAGYGSVLTTPIGTLIDGTERKRSIPLLAPVSGAGLVSRTLARILSLLGFARSPSAGDAG